jgi:hypothetical protein
MPATTYEELYDFPGNIAAAAKAILVADIDALIGEDEIANPETFITGPRENVELPKSRIEVTATPFQQASDQQIQATSNSEWFFAHHSGQIVFTVVTPLAVATSTAMHGTRVGRVQFLMQPKAARFTSSNLPYYEIVALRLATFTRGEPDEEEDVYRSELVYNVETWMRPGSFPATVP